MKMKEKITYVFTAGNNVMEARCDGGKHDLSQEKIKEFGEEYAEKWGVNLEDITVTRQLQ